MAFSNEQWKMNAACRGQDVNDWFAPANQLPPHVLNTCAGCVVRQECFDYALEEGLDYGVFGGVTGRQRLRLKVREQWQSK